MMTMRPSTVVLAVLLLVLGWDTRHILVPVTATAVPWVATQPAALGVLLLAALYWRATHPTTEIRIR